MTDAMTAGPAATGPRHGEDLMTDKTATATVQTLTAEVRTLVVGSRQVTLSVYNQLDDVFCDEMEPFGRVRPKGAFPYGIHVIGRSARTEDSGALVSSWVPDRKAIDTLRRGEGLPTETGHWIPSIWRDSSRREAIERASIEWQRLPLIVLAGLR